MLIEYREDKSFHAVPLYFCHLLLAELHLVVLVGTLVAEVTAGSNPTAKSSNRASISVTKLEYVLVIVGFK